MPRCYMVKKNNHRHEGPPPCSPTEASVAPPCYSPDEHSALTEPRAAEYAELGSTFVSQRSAADTQAAHDLLALAQGLPPLPPTTVVTVLHAPDPPLVPIYTYTIQPTNFYILADEPHKPIYHTVQTVQHPVPPVQDLSQVQHITPVQDLSQVQHITPVPDVTPLQTVDYVDQSVNYVPYQTSEETQTEFTEAEIHFTQEELVEEKPEEDWAQESRAGAQEMRYARKAKYACSECGKRYATSSNLSRHKQTHRSLDSVSAKRCGECGKAYVSMPALAMHVLTHRMGHVCGVCGKQFSRPWLLRGHLRSHTGEKPYRCGECGKSFADRSNLRAHLQTHSYDRKHECLHCRKTFALKSYLNKHQEAACVRDDEDE